MRDTLDRYYTPAWPTKALLERYMLTGGTCILEPCAGTGGIAQVLKGVGRNIRVITGDIDPSVDVDHHWDFTQAQFRPDDFIKRLGQRPRNIITNPPYTVAEQVARAGLAICNNVCLLLRLTWLEPVPSRLDLLQNLHRVLILPRVDYKGDGKSDSTGSAWFIWNGTRKLAPGIAGEYGHTVFTEFVPSSERPPRTERLHRPLGREQDPIQGSLLGGGHG